MRTDKLVELVHSFAAERLKLLSAARPRITQPHQVLLVVRVDVQRLSPTGGAKRKRQQDGQGTLLPLIRSGPHNAPAGRPMRCCLLICLRYVAMTVSISSGCSFLSFAMWRLYATSSAAFACASLGRTRRKNRDLALFRFSMSARGVRRFT